LSLVGNFSSFRHVPFPLKINYSMKLFCIGNKVLKKWFMERWVREMAVNEENNLPISFGDPEGVDGLSVHSEEFDHTFYYEGNDLGTQYSPERTAFRLWAPTVSEAKVVLYSTWDGEAIEEEVMTRSEKGTWVLVKEGNYAGMLYTYKVRIGTYWNEAVDPYAKAVGINGDRGAIIDLSITNPDHWTDEKPTLDSPLDAIIYELHVRDLSIHPESGIHHNGKFLGITERGTLGPNGISTGLDHIRNLGITHVQLLPIYDYSTESVDETRLEEPQYNWGYNPKNYNVPEGSYSTNPYDPVSRIKEMKQMIQTLHESGLRVIMDVVYNHVYDAVNMSFGKLVPGYFYRYTEDGEHSNGSGCGNDIASERKMVRKFILDSVTYLTREYHLDGFRFDLMGLHDVETMNEVRRRLDEIDPSLILIGEGWDLQTPLEHEKKATQYNALKMPRIGHFNDGIRDALKGSALNEYDTGFISGKEGLEHEIRKGIVGGIKYSHDIQSFANEPDQTVTYVEAHDDHTLWDKLVITTSLSNDQTREKMHKLASAIILTSQGIAFLHAGQEFMRTKGGQRNSYNLSTEVNQLDWTRCSEFYGVVEYVKALIHLRKKHPAFRMRSAHDIRTHLFFEDVPVKAVAYSIRNHANGDPSRNLYIVHNANDHSIEVTLPCSKNWHVVFGKEHITENREIYSFEQPLKVEGFGSVVLSSEDHIE
jgi:pullulanase